MLTIVTTNQFKKDLKSALKQGLDLNELYTVVNVLASEKKLDEKYKDHNLSGKYKGYRECHIEPDWLLIYRVNRKSLELFLFRTGSHSKLFDGYCYSA